MFTKINLFNFFKYVGKISTPNFKHPASNQALFRCITCASYLSPLELQLHGEKLAVIDHGKPHSYSEILKLSYLLKNIVQARHEIPLHGERVAFLTENDAKYVICVWAIWLCGAIAVPLCPKHPISEIKYVLENAEVNTVISAKQFLKVTKPLAEDFNIKHVSLPADISTLKNMNTDDHNSFSNLKETCGLIVYTSGSTGRPKGVLHSISSLNSQVCDMVQSWKWSADDVVLHILPLHHIHGIVNLLLCPLAVGAVVVLEKSFDPKNVWNHLMQNSNPRVNVFMAVPTVYAKLIEYFEEHKMNKITTRKACSNIRLMVSGSAALPVSFLEKWKDITGHTLLERYGMTEIGMGLTNPYEGQRIPGTVGLPFSSVSVKVVPSDKDGNIDLKDCVVHAEEHTVNVTPGRENEEGHLLVKSPSIFKCYWKNDAATSESFIDGWFITGDTAVYKNGTFRIVGRTSVDIIKSGGYKIGALDIEQKLLIHPAIHEVSVIGVQDSMWGQKVAAVVKLQDGKELSGKELRDWCRNYMASYQIPKEIIFVSELPRNLMGKVNKKDLLTKYFSNGAST